MIRMVWNLVGEMFLCRVYCVLFSLFCSFFTIIIVHTSTKVQFMNPFDSCILFIVCS